MAAERIEIRPEVQNSTKGSRGWNTKRPHAKLLQPVDPEALGEF
jgi:hypothetical protein